VHNLEAVVFVFPQCNLPLFVKVLYTKCVGFFHNKDVTVNVDLPAGRQDTTSIITRIPAPC
jgi:hypothetical protein